MIEQLQKKAIELLKAGNREDAQIVRDIISELKNKEIELQHGISNDEAIAVMRKMVKKLEDAIDQFEEGGRDDLAEENRAEIALIQSFLPAELSDEIVEKRVREFVEKNKGIDKGRLIGMAVKELGKEIDPSRIAKIIGKL